METNYGPSGRSNPNNVSLKTSPIKHKYNYMIAKVFLLANLATIVKKKNIL